MSTYLSVRTASDWPRCDHMTLTWKDMWEDTHPTPGWYFTKVPNHSYYIYLVPDPRLVTCTKPVLAIWYNQFHKTRHCTRLVIKHVLNVVI